MTTVDKQLSIFLKETLLWSVIEACELWYSKNILRFVISYFCQNPTNQWNGFTIQYRMETIHFILKDKNFFQIQRQTSDGDYRSKFMRQKNMKILVII